MLYSIFGCLTAVIFESLKLFCRLFNKYCDVLLKMTSTKFTWKIENFSCLKDGMLQSPSFSSHTATWEIRIFPIGSTNDGNCIDFKLHRILPEVNYSADLYNSFAFLDFEGSPLVWREDKYSCVGYFKIRKDEFRLLKEKLLPNDILTMECRIWQIDSDLLVVDACFARTRAERLSEVIEKTFTLRITGVRSFQTNQSKKYQHSVTRHRDKVKITLFFNDYEKLEAAIRFSLVKTSSKCKIFLLDATGKHIQFADSEFSFNTKGEKWLLSTDITKVMLRCHQDMFLSNDTLTLVFAFTFSCKITFSRMVEENEMHFHNPQSHMNDPRLTSAEHESHELSENPNELEPSNRSNPVNISQVLRKMYEQGYMSDFSIRVEDRTFPVHKAILGARSSVFEVMFYVDMKEKASGSVDIPDVDADTIQRMLKFIYCDSVQEDMQWEVASSLYAAADKYAIEPLKQRCSDILKSELCASSVLGVLLLGATYQDQDLETAALEFIGRNDKLIIGTEPWCKFEEHNPQIANDVFRKLYIRKMNE